MQANGYTNAQLGLVMALGNILGFVLGPAVSSAVDRYEKITVLRVGPVLFAVQLGALLLLCLLPQKAVISCAFVLYIGFCTCVNAINTKLYVDLEKRGNTINFGFARAIGSLCFVLLSLLLGALVIRAGVRVLPVCGIVLVLLQLLLYALVSVQTDGLRGLKAETEAVQSSSLAGFFKKYPQYSVMLLGTALLFAAHNGVCNFLINLAKNVGGDTGTMGLLNGWMAMVEIPVMMLYARFSRGRDCGRLLRFAFALFTVKALALALAGTVPTLFAAVMLQAPSFALYATAIVDYAKREIPYEDSAKAQSLAYAMTTLGSTVASVAAGAMYDAFSVRTTLLVCAAVSAVGSAVSVAAVRTEKK